MGQASKEIATKIAILEALKTASAPSSKGYMNHSELCKAVRKTAKSKPTFHSYYLQLKNDQPPSVTATRDPDDVRADRISITPDGEQELLYLQLASQTDRLRNPTKRDRKDYDKLLIDAVESRNDEGFQRLAAHPASIKIARFSRLLEAAYSAFCNIHNPPAGIYVRVKDGNLEFLTQEYLTFLKEKETTDAGNERESLPFKEPSE